MLCYFKTNSGILTSLQRISIETQIRQVKSDLQEMAFMAISLMRQILINGPLFLAYFMHEKKL